MGTSGFVGFVVDGVEKIFLSHKDSYPSGLGEEVLEWLTRNRKDTEPPMPDEVTQRVRALRVVGARPTPALADVDRLRSLLCDRAREDSMRAYLEAGSAEQVLQWASDDLEILVLAGLTPHLSMADVQRVRNVLLDRAEDDSDRTYYAAASIEELLELATYDLGTLLQAGIIIDGSGYPVDSLVSEWGYLIDLDTATFEVYRGFQNQPHTTGRFAHRPPVHENYYPVALVASWPLADLPDQASFLALPGAY